MQLRIREPPIYIVVAPHMIVYVDGTYIRAYQLMHEVISLKYIRVFDTISVDVIF